CRRGRRPDACARRSPPLRPPKRRSSSRRHIGAGPRRRARVHAAVARAIEETDAGKLGERAALLAYHWEHAGDAREAAKWHRRAAEWVGLNNSAEALRHWGSVRQLLDTLPEAAEDLAERATVRAQIMIHLARMGDVEDQATS